MAKPQGAGSIWNPNSWHWEEKNYTTIARQLIEQKIKAIKVESGDIILTNIELKSISGDAQVNIRKGKQVLVYDFDIEVEWRGSNESDEAEGTYKIKDLNSLDNDFELIHINSRSKTKISDKCKDMVKRDMHMKLKESFKTLMQEIGQFESDPEKLKKDQEARKHAEEQIKQAKEQNGELKERIFQEQKLKEMKMKQEFTQVSSQ
ncbi:unnamed protein product (macronuclear) [Paramecium tetraurelia]|uniref:Activator of Hsp90 ATPase AHSA1-like N-terminal domain-containing protein n=1 Tax=Paramecium tetraurelia TaxID=5888 RepID=A0CL58_PARTE|nr:uncharacterized protein GSPATT00008072001 [Paramecium tetraurelia]CAK71525.1 unnamed protein product [Paramecium tetraurelia]|eukprot:XP_001438922.1 hypothetical protein (macronuclear) [Paramecium tetraurelia strain d4-2]